MRLTPPRAALLLTFGLLLAACEPTMVNRGNMLDADRLAEIKPGTTTREEVATRLGTPTQIGTFDENVWYYVGRRTEQYSFFDPEVIEQKAVAVRFNDQGVVTAVKKLDAAESQDVDPVTRRTPTYGHETTVLEQLLGNLSSKGLGPKSKKK